MNKYKPDNVKLLFTDTDSLCYNIQTHDIYEDLLKDKDNLIIVIMIQHQNSFLKKIKKLLEK